jgi:hypothetical protein
MIESAQLSATHGIENLLHLKEKKAAARDDNKKSISIIIISIRIGIRNISNIISISISNTNNYYY